MFAIKISDCTQIHFSIRFFVSLFRNKATVLRTSRSNHGDYGIEEGRGTKDENKELTETRTLEESAVVRVAA